MEPHVKVPPTAPRRVWPYIAAVILAVVIGLAAFFLSNVTNRNLVSGLTADPAKNLEVTNGRTNILFLGMGGVGHEAPELTDSIIVVSLRHRDHSVSLISVPRDVWVDTLKDKVNKAYKYGNEKRAGGGRDLAKSAVSEIIGMPIHSVVSLDFRGFVKAIDAVGGVDVVVDRTFDDYKYPIPGKETAEPESERYEHLHFDAGPTHLDGVMALKFARSRHALGEEGTDFARSVRQQKILVAFKDKLTQSKIFLNSDTIKNVFTSFSSSIDTDIVENEYGSYLKFFLNFQNSDQKIKSVTIENFFVNPKNTRPYQGQWVLIPTRDWKEIHDYVAKSLE